MENATDSTIVSSTKKADRRVVRTRKAIKTALENLLETEHVNKITVSAIAREADIDRKTFYLHYATIDDLIRDIAADNIHEIEEQLETEGQGKSAQECVHIVLGAINRIIQENSGRYENIVASLSIDQILERIETHSEYLFAQMTVRTTSLARGNDPQQLHMRLRFYLAGALALYTEWLSSDKSVPIESVSEIVESALTTNLFGAA